MPKGNVTSGGVGSEWFPDDFDGFDRLRQAL